VLKRPCDMLPQRGVYLAQDGDGGWTVLVRRACGHVRTCHLRQMRLRTRIAVVVSSIATLRADRPRSRYSGGMRITTLLFERAWRRGVACGLPAGGRDEQILHPPGCPSLPAFLFLLLIFGSAGILPIGWDGGRCGGPGRRTGRGGRTACGTATALPSPFLLPGIISHGARRFVLPHPPRRTVPSAIPSFCWYSAISISCL